jgi:hypothetical protein
MRFRRRADGSRAIAVARNDSTLRILQPARDRVVATADRKH